MESASDIFYDIYDNGGQSDVITTLLRQLDFHALSITLLATTASHNMWDYNRLAGEWDAHRVEVLQTDYNESLATTIELSLSSPTFCELSSNARDLLGVVAFFPQGIDENNLSWLLPTISDGRNIFDKFCLLSLTYQTNGFLSMLAPLRDYLCPKDPASSPFLSATKDRYFSRLSVYVAPGEPGFEEARWITSEDVNVEHLLDVFITIDPNSTNIWDVCACFMRHLFWHKRRLVMLGSKIEGLLDDHCSKPQCLFQLSQLFGSVGNEGERKRLLLRTLKLQREPGDRSEVAETLGFLSDANRQLGLSEEGIEQAEEALEMFEQLDDKWGQANSWDWLAWLLYHDDQLGAAEEAASEAINLFLDEGEQFLACGCHRLLGLIYSSAGETEEAIDHFETALGIASAFNSHDEQFWSHFHLAALFSDEDRSIDAHAHIEHVKLHAINDPYLLGRAMEVHGSVWYEESKFEEAKSETLRAADVFEKLGASKELERCRDLNGYFLNVVLSLLPHPPSSWYSLPCD